MITKRDNLHTYHRHTDTYFNLLFVFLLFSYFEAFQHMPLHEGFRRHARNYKVIESHTGTPWISAECRQGYPTSIKALSFQSIIIKRKQLHLQMAKMPIDQRFMLNIMWCDWTWCSALILSWTAPVNPSHVKDTNCQEINIFLNHFVVLGGSVTEWSARRTRNPAVLGNVSRKSR